MPESLERQGYKIKSDLCAIEGQCRYALICFGDHVAKREKYKKHQGLEALHYYLIQKHHWLPAQVKSLNDEDLEFLFAEEMHTWTLPKEAIF